MGNLRFHAENELDAVGYKETSEEMDKMMRKDVLQLIDVFAKQGHSGGTASECISLFSRLASFEPLTPIKGTDEEWFEVERGLFQNRRLSSVFKNGRDEKPYYLDAIVWEEGDDDRFTSEDVFGIASRQPIELPFIPKTFYVKVNREKKLIDSAALLDAINYYPRNIKVILDLIQTHGVKDFNEKSNNPE